MTLKNIQNLSRVVELHSFWTKERNHMTPKGSFDPSPWRTFWKEGSMSEKSIGPMASWLGRAHLSWEMVKWFDGLRTKLCESETYSFADIYLLQFCFTFPDSSMRKTCCLPTHSWLLQDLMNLWRFPHASRECRIYIFIYITVVPFFKTLSSVFFFFFFSSTEFTET